MTTERLAEIKALNHRVLETRPDAPSFHSMLAMRDRAELSGIAVPELIAKVEQLRDNPPRFSEEVYESARAALDRSPGSLVGRDEFCIDKAMYVCRMVLLRDAPDEYEADRLRERNAAP